VTRRTNVQLLLSVQPSDQREVTLFLGPSWSGLPEQDVIPETRVLPGGTSVMQSGLSMEVSA